MLLVTSIHVAGTLHVRIRGCSGTCMFGQTLDSGVFVVGLVLMQGFSLEGELQSITKDLLRDCSTAEEFSQ